MPADRVLTLEKITRALETSVPIEDSPISRAKHQEALALSSRELTSARAVHASPAYPDPMALLETGARFCRFGSGA